MTFATADPVSSGQPHTVREVAGHAPEGLSDFVGETMLTVVCPHQVHEVTGSGTQHGETVRFYEKDRHSGKDVRVWRITPAADGGFIAESLPSGHD